MTLFIEIQGDHGGPCLSFVGLILEVPQYFPTTMPFLPKQNWADSGTTKFKST